MSEQPTQLRRITKYYNYKYVRLIDNAYEERFATVNSCEASNGVYEYHCLVFPAAARHSKVA